MNTGFLGPAVATVLTACGIETEVKWGAKQTGLSGVLQQYLPLAVLKLTGSAASVLSGSKLQQYLPLAVLKLRWRRRASTSSNSCNSTYRLRY